MSGGHFDYPGFPIHDFAEKLQFEIENNEKPAEGDSDHFPQEFDEKTINRLKFVRNLTFLVSDLAYHVDYLYSADTSPEGFEKNFKKALKKYVEMSMNEK